MGAAVSADSGKSTAPPPTWIQFDPSPVTPDFRKGENTHDPNYGFDGQTRKERTPPVTPEQLASAKVPPEWRDYCAHKFIEFTKCKKYNFPIVTRCHHARHELEECQYQEVIHRMKEYERERRLLHRKQRKEAKKSKE